MYACVPCWRNNTSVVSDLVYKVVFPQLGLLSGIFFTILTIDSLNYNAETQLKDLCVTDESAPEFTGSAVKLSFGDDGLASESGSDFGDFDDFPELKAILAKPCSAVKFMWSEDNKTEILLKDQDVNSAAEKLTFRNDSPAVQDGSNYKMVTKGGAGIFDLDKPNGEMIINVEGVNVLARPSGFGYENPRSQKKLIGGGKDTGKPKRKSLKGCESVLCSVVKEHSRHNLSPQGPFGEACVLLKMKNTKVNRNRLRTFYQRNKLCHVVPEERSNLSVEEKIAVERKSKRQPKQRMRYSDSLYREKVGQNQSFCVCSATSETWQDNGAMVKCEACSSWYHYKCICMSNKKLLKKIVHGKNVHFICGFSTCKFDEGVLRVKGTTYTLKKTVDLSEIDFEDNCLTSQKQEETDKAIETSVDNKDVDDKGYDNLESCDNEGTCDKDLNDKSTCVDETLVSSIICNENCQNTESIETSVDNKDVEDKGYDNMESCDNEGTCDTDLIDKSTCVDETLVSSIICNENCQNTEPNEQHTSLDLQKTDVFQNFINCKLSFSDESEASDFKTLLNVFENVKYLANKFVNLKASKNDSEHVMQYDSIVETLKSCSNTVSKVVFIDNDRLSQLKASLSEMILSFIADVQQHYDSVSNKLESKVNPSECTDPGFSNETISAILGKTVPSDYFTFQIPLTATFSFDELVWNCLYIERQKRCFKKNSWQQYFIQGMKKSNPYCVFKFISHKISSAEKRAKPLSAPLFSAYGNCVFTDCSCSFVLKMFSKSSVQVQYKGNVKHSIREKNARNITGDEREALKSQFKSGVKPLKMLLDKIDGIDADMIVSGNRDGLGNTLEVFSKIASESRQGGRHNSNLFESLMSLKDDMFAKLSGGFIQKISIYPMYILYWSDFGLQIFKDRANNNAVYWDATGSIVRTSEKGKKFLYYEMAVSNPVKGKMGIPICSMISENQSLPIVLDWLQSFKQSLKKKFGHSSSLIPKYIISDQSMVLILAALKIFNDETLEQYLIRCFDFVTSLNQYEMKKTILCLCLSHFMKSVKTYLHRKEVGTEKTKFFLYVIGILKQCNSIPDYKELLFDIFITAGSRYITQKNTVYIDRLLKKINMFDPKSLDLCDIGNIEAELTPVNPNAFNENDFQILGASSPFKDVAFKIHKLSSDYFQDKHKEDQQASRFFCPIFVDYLLNWLLPIFPLWSAIVHSNPKSENTSKPPSTNGLIENRFRILKEIYLQRRSKHRLDEFSELLKNHTISVQKLAISENLKVSKGKRKRNALCNKSLNNEPVQKKVKKSQLVEEEWSKKRPQSTPLESNSKIGKYQKAPKRHIVIEKTEKKLSTFTSKSEHAISKVGSSKSAKKACRLTNFGNTCWFNSVIQAVFFTNLRNRLINYKDSSLFIHLIEKSAKTLAIESIIELWRSMCYEENLGKKINDSLLHIALTRTCTVVPGFTQNAQQDAQEFISSVICDISKTLSDSMHLWIRQTCLNCKNVESKIVEEGSVIFLPLQKGLSNVSLQTLIENLNVFEEQTILCSPCQKNTIHSIKRQITVFPQTLMIVVGRFAYQQNNHRLTKLQNDIYVNSHLDFYSGQNGKQMFHFKSAVCHYGETVHSGHYKAIVNVGETLLSCSDLDISETTTEEMLSTAYIVLYDRAAPILPDFFKKLLNILKQTKCYLEITKHYKFEYIPKVKQNIVEMLHINGFTEEFERNFSLSVSNVLHKDFDMKHQLPSVKDFVEIFFQYILPKENGNCCSVREELFNLVQVSSFSCEKCNFVERYIHKSFVTTIYHHFDINNIFQGSLNITDSHTHQACKCGTVTKEVSILSLPYVLIFEYPSFLCEYLRKFSILDLSTLKNFSVPQFHDKFELAMILCKNELCTIILEKCNDSFVCVETKKKYSNPEIMKFKDIFLFFVKMNEDFDYASVLNKHCINTHKLFDVKMDYSIGLALPNTVLPRKIFGVILSKHFFDTLLSETSWLSSDHINVYLSIICQISKKNVHLVDSGWYSSRLCQSGNMKEPVNFFDSVEGNLAWLDFDCIVIPVNDNNTHWSVAVIDSKNKLIIYCNSYGSTLQSYIVCSQIWRYICFDSVMHKNKSPRKREWHVSFYNDELNFPIQTDSASCGVYVCGVVKAILNDAKLPKKPNLPGFRKAIAFEISNFKRS